MRTRPKPLDANSVFSKFITWFSLLGILLISIISILTYYNTTQLIQIAQERKEIALAKGLAFAISDYIVTHDYSQLENSALQIMADENINSIIVTDLHGATLTFLERKTAGGLITSNFSIFNVEPPKSLASEFLIEKTENTSQVWYKIDPGIQLGWIRIETLKNTDDILLRNYRMNIFLSVIILFAVILSIGIAFFYQAKLKIKEGEMHLIKDNRILYDIAHLDFLTKLPNRLTLNNSMVSAMAVARKDSDLLAICFLDLDGFKGVNDRMGHLIGDQLLIAVANRLKGVARDDDSVIRLGGDEFALILVGIKNKVQLDVLLRRILELLSSPYMIEDHIITISASIGVTIYPDDDVNIEDLLAHADIAMYESKRQGKNTWSLYQVT